MSARTIACSFFIVAMMMTISRSEAIDYPFSISDAQAAGEHSTPQAILADTAYRLTGPTNRAPSALVITPFRFAEYTYAKLHQTSGAATAADSGTKTNNFLAIEISAFSKIVKANDEMKLVLKQRGKVIQAYDTGTPSASATDYPEVGYSIAGF